MKKARKALALLLAVSMCVSTFSLAAAAEEEDSSTAAAEEESEDTETVTLAEGASFELMEDVTVTDSDYNTDHNAFYLYSPSDPHDFDLMSGQLNGVIFVYPDTIPESEEEALELLDSMGLLTIAEESPAYIIIPLPLNGESYTEEDLNVYYTSQFYLAGGKIVSLTPPTGEYDRHTYNNLQYIIAEGDGATFVNNVLSQHASRIAGILTFGGDMDVTLTTGLAVPAYLVNASSTAISYYKAVNEVDTETEDGHFVNSSYTEKQVYVVDGDSSFDADIIATAWADMLSRTTRAAMQENVVTNTFDMSEWVLMTWPNYDELGLTISETSYTWGDEDNEETEYIEYDYIPSSYTGEEAVPLVVLLHGYTEDPLCPAATCGWADVCAEEGFILIAPDYINDLNGTGVVIDCIMTAVEQALETYNIDTSRIYCTGFSMGGASTMLTGFANADLFAAVAPMAGTADITDFALDADTYDLPTFFLCGNIDTNNVETDEDGNTSFTAMGGNVWPTLAAYNGIELGDPDYTINSYGYEADETYTETYQDIEYTFNDFYVDGYTNPILELVEVDNVAHACSNVYATLAWDFMSSFTRSEDGTIVEAEYDADAEEEAEEACAQDETCPISQYTDADASAWYHDGVHYAIENGYMIGTSGTTWEPDTATTRAMLVTVLYRLAGSPEVEGTSSFTDAEAGSWYEDALIWAEQSGIAEGYGTGEFGVDDTVTREQIAAFFYRYDILMSGEEEAAEAADLTVYPDYEDVSDWAEEAMNWAVSTGLLEGEVEGGETILAPADSCTRAMMATILQRYAEAE